MNVDAYALEMVKLIHILEYLFIAVVDSFYVLHNLHMAATQRGGGDLRVSY